MSIGTLANRLNSIFESIGEGQLRSAALLAKELQCEDLFPLDLFEALSGIWSRESSSPAIWRRFLDDLAKNYRAKVVFSTFTASSTFELSSVEPAMTRSGNAELRVVPHTQAELVTLGDQEISLSFSPLPDARHVVSHMILAFPSNVNDSFYVSFEGEESNEYLRFSNSQVTLCSDGSIVELNARVRRLYSLLVSPTAIELYVDGILRKRRRRSGGDSFRTFTLKLRGSPGADLSGVLHGFEVWCSDEPFKGFYPNDQRLLAAQLETAILRDDAHAVSELLTSYDDSSIEGLRDKILAMLSKQLDKKGNQEWLFQEILSRISPGDSKAWIAENGSRFPEPLLSVESVGARFLRLPNKRFALSRLLRSRSSGEFDVIKDVSFKVFPGDVLGIIGANGAGKSTLLRTIAGLVPITQGRIATRGKHLLLSPGMGIREELSGRANIYLAGCFMGYTKDEIDRLYDEIVDFSELSESIDQPFKYYSDGMKSRLIFSIATSVAPEILMLDELLGAGDVKFQDKAVRKMNELIDRARAVVIVTHSLSFVALRCNKALLLAHGKQLFYGDPKRAISFYLNELHLPPRKEYSLTRY